VIKPRRLGLSPHLPRRTVRLRLTLLYGGLFLVSGAALLATTYVLFNHATSGNTFLFTSGNGAPPGMVLRGATHPGSKQLQKRVEPGHEAGRATAARAVSNARHQRAAERHQLLVQSGIALGIMTVLSLALGWLVAGRVLAPLRTMTAKARRISDANLHERLDVQGPSDELKELGDTIDELLARLQDAFDAQRRFVANASHELRTPLAMMRTSLDVATRKPGAVPTQVTVLGAKFREGLDQADRLLESFLTLARAQNGTLIDQTAVLIADIVADAIRARRDAIEAKRIELRADVDEIVVNGSETLLSRMVENLIDNAARHNQSGGWISVRAQRDGDVARMIIENGGPRLDQRRVRELAQPFRRLGADRTGAADSVGLGLSIVSAIATAHGGKLRLSARPDGGLRAVIELPYERQLASDLAAPRSASVAAR
jgi:signal transduction histidine kinase